MLRAIRRIQLTKGALVPALASALGMAAGIASCITGPPADPPNPPALGPTIIQDAVMPPREGYLTQLPDAFIVPVRVFNPNAPISCNVFVDFDPGLQNSQTARGVATVCGLISPALEGGVTDLTFTLSQTELAGPNVIDPNACHTIVCFVAEAFSKVSAHVPGTTLGADSVVWHYAPNGPGSCALFDAGDGAFPPDAPSDAGVLLLDSPPL